MEFLCDTITGGNSCNLMEATEPMEVYSPVTAAFPTKRKAESDLADEIEESSVEIGESGDEIEESSDEIGENSGEIEESGDKIGESGDDIEEIGHEIEEIGGEIEESGDSCVDYINEYYKSKWITPEWDVDSFDGLEFDSSQEESECIDDGEEDDLDVEKWIRFRRQHIANKGFYVEPELWPMYQYSDHYVIEDLESPAGRFQTYRGLFTEMACLCLERFNKDRKEKNEKEKNESFINVEFVEVVGGVIRPSGKPKALITFKAKEKPDGPLVEYQAKVWSSLVEDKNCPKTYVTEHYPILCRPAPPPRKAITAPATM